MFVAHNGAREPLNLFELSHRLGCAKLISCSTEHQGNEVGSDRKEKYDVIS